MAKMNQMVCVIPRNRIIKKYMKPGLLLVLLATTANAATWTRVATPHFELYTTENEKAARAGILHFEQVRNFFLQASPIKASAVQPGNEAPARLIAFSGRDQFVNYTPNTRAAAYYTPNSRHDYIVMTDLSPESNRFAVHEYMHLIVRHSGLRIPLWLNEGWAEVYSSLRTVKDGVAVGDLLPDRMKALEATPWLDFQTLTAVDGKSPIYNEGDRTGLFYAQSWALTHMLFLAPDYKANFGRFVMALHRGATTEDAFRQAYNKSGDQVFSDLHKYFDRRKLFGAVFQVQLPKTDAEPQSAPVSDFASALMLGDLQAALHHPDQANAEYAKAIKESPDNADLMLSLGYLAAEQRDLALARRYFTRAWDAGSKDPQMCLALAIVEISEKSPPSKIIPILERALQSRPGFPEALMYLGQQRIQAHQYEAAAQAFLSIANVTPEQAPDVFRDLAYATLETGDVPKAREHALTAQKWSKTPEAQQKLAQLLDLITAREHLNPPPQPGEKLEIVDGTVQGLECTPAGKRLHLQAGMRNLTFAVPDLKAIEILSTHGGTVTLKCGPATPFPLTVTHAGDVVRRLEF